MKRSRRKFLSEVARFSGAGSVMTSSFYGMSKIGQRNQSWLVNKFGPNDMVRIGIIGTGGRGTNLIRNIGEINGMDVVACCDIIPFRLEEGLKHASSGAKGYSDYRRLIEDHGLDAVIIATPLHLHFEMAKACLDAGKHVYCEKTMTFTIEEAKKLGPIVENANSLFQVGYQHRYNPLYSQVKEIIRGDEFGPLSRIECFWNRNGNWRRPVPDPKLERLINWRMYREYSGGMMAELSSHQLNIVNWMIEESPLMVSGFGGIDYWKDGRETFDNIHATFVYPGGVKVSCTCLTTNAQMGFQMKFYGKNGTIQIVREDNYTARLWVEPTYLLTYEDAKKEKVDGVSGATALLKKGEPISLYNAAPGKEDAEPTMLALANFGICVRENKQPLVGYESGRESAYCVALANRAMHSGEIVYWKDWV